jgi:hypothetical protein
MKYVWTHKQWCRPSDPVNIIFENISLDEIEKFLINNGWERAKPLLVWDHFIPDPDPLNKRKQDLQLIKPIRWKILKRVHVRLWERDNRVIGGVHIDVLRVTKHYLTDFESVEKYFANICRTNSNWMVQDDAEDLDNRIAGYGQPYNNGKATVIRRKIN